ncbi:MAG: acetoacetate--CoA ligase [Rhodospirillaceae bacterium]|nr:acetoacetate--CoA ligase [Rhodospirillaceae bacterium]
MNPILWQPSKQRIEQTNIARLMNAAGISDFNDFYDFSINSPEKFWDLVRTDSNLVATHWGDRVLENKDAMPGAKWFGDARLNYAENLLQGPSTDNSGDSDAIIFRGEDKASYRLSWNQLRAEVSRVSQGLKEAGIKPGDRIVGYLPNMPEAVIAMLATTAIGAVWSSCSPDFGVEGVIERFKQIEPKVLFAAEGYYYGGKRFDCMEKLSSIQKKLPTLIQTVIVEYTQAATNLATLDAAVTWDDFISGFIAGEIEYTHLPFDHPLFIMFSSGTTGVPKCIVHGAGGTLIQHTKEHLYHCDIKPADKVFYFTTCGWMMWNWLVSALASGATLMLYDGSPFHPGPQALFDYIDTENITFFGTSAKYIDALKQNGFSASKSHKLENLKTIASTGSPLVAESFEYVYQNIKADVQLASISGGTDIVSCFILGNPIGPVRRGEIQTRGLGMAVDVFNDDGLPVRCEKGELVCTKPFPSMPIGFWNDPDGKKYGAAYFERFPGIWHHGDFIEITESGGIIAYGRSDATLNPGGVRIGTAEIYRQVEQLGEIVESIAIGQQWQGDVRIILFVVLAAGATLDENLVSTIKRQIKEKCSPRHVPAKIIAVSDIPRTRSGKITEIAVRDAVAGNQIKNKEALLNPEALLNFTGLDELKT